MSKYLFGIDIGGTTVKIGFFLDSGKLLDKWEIPTRTINNGKEILPDIAQSIKDKMVKEHLTNQDIIGAGLGVPGPIINNEIVNKCVNLGWPKKNVAEEFNKLTGLYTQVGNDANMAALGEMWQGGGVGFNDVVFVTLGTGVGGGVIVNGKIICGNNGAGGEIGHIHVVDDEVETCGCGNHGCLEQYASANGLVRVGKRILSKEHQVTSLDKYTNLTAKDICDEAKKGDKVANECVSYSMGLLGKALASISCVCDPDIYVIGGGLSKAGNFLIEEIRKSYEKYAFHACKETRFELAKLGNDAGMYGAAKLILG